MPSPSPHQIKNFEIERAFLHCVLKDSLWLAEISQLIKPEFFAYAPNQKLFAAIRSIHNEGKAVDSYLLISRLALMGLNTVDSLPVAEYVESISRMSVRTDSKHDYLAEISKFYWARMVYKKLGTAQKFVTENLNLSFADILHGTEKLVVDALTDQAVNSEDCQFIDLYADMQAILDGQINKVGAEGVPTPFPTFERWYGRLTVGDLFVFAAPSKVGKSTFLNAIADHAISWGEGRVKVLFLDTELEGWRVACRNMAARSGVNEFYYRTGKFAEDQVKIEKTQEALPHFTRYPGCYLHHYIPEASEDKIERIVRRWYSQHIKEGDIALVILDYLKFSGGEDRSAGGAQELKEYELVGKKTDKLKQLASSLPNMVCVSAIQTNRSNDIAQSDRIKWFASSVFTINRKTPEEIGREGGKHGTHVIKAVVTRNQGEGGNEAGAFSASDGKETRWYENYICLDFQNFRVEERGTFKDVIENAVSAGQLTPRTSASDRNREQFKKYSEKS